MRSTNHNKINEELIDVFNEENNFTLAKKLEDKNYASPFDRSEDFYLRWTLSQYRTELSCDYFRIVY